MSQPIQPTPEVRGYISSLIRRGAYPHTAARTAGVPREVFDDWLARGRGPNAEPEYRDFADEVNQAEATARAMAEMKVWETDPKLWLRNGPGRERPGVPGWTTTAPAFPPTEEAGSLLEDIRWNRRLGKLAEAMSEYPEVRAKLALLAAEIESDASGE